MPNDDGITMTRFTICYWLFAGLWCAGVHPPALSLFLLLYLAICAVWIPYRVFAWLTTKKEPAKVTPPPPEQVPEPELPPPPPPPPTREELADAAQDKYAATLRLLAAADLDDFEFQTACDKAKQQYLRELDEVMK